MAERDPTSEISSPSDNKGNLKKRALTGIVLAAGTFGINRAVETASMIEAFTSGVMRQYIENHPYEMLAAVFALNVPFGIWSSVLTVKLLKNENIGISPNLWADLAYYLIRKPAKVRNIAAAVAPRVITMDWLRLSAAFASEQALAGVVAYKTISTFISIIHNMGEIVALKTLGKEKVKKGLIFDATLHRFGKLLKRP